MKKLLEYFNLFSLLLLFPSFSFFFFEWNRDSSDRRQNRKTLGVILSDTKVVSIEGRRHLNHKTTINKWRECRAQCTAWIQTNKKGMLWRHLHYIGQWQKNHTGWLLNGLHWFLLASCLVRGKSVLREHVYSTDEEWAWDHIAVISAVKAYFCIDNGWGVCLATLQKWA